jgi:hypothetical protein
MSKHKRLTDAYRFRGFTSFQTVKGIFGDPKARVIMLKRSPKKQSVQPVEWRTGVFMIVSSGVCATSPVAIRGCFWNWRYAVSNAGVAAG